MSKKRFEIEKEQLEKRVTMRLTRSVEIQEVLNEGL